MFYCIHLLQSWIHEKAKVIESTDELGNDLAGVMTLQRRLSTMERDLAAIQAKVIETLKYECVIEICMKLNRYAKSEKSSLLLINIIYIFNT